MKKVNRAFLNDILNPLAGGADMDDMAFYENIDSNNEQVMKQIIVSVLLPYFNQKSEKYKSVLKDSFKYYLAVPNFDFESIIESNLLPFYTPDQPKNLYVWLWEVFWASEKFEIQTLNDYLEKYDIYEPLRLSN